MDPLRHARRFAAGFPAFFLPVFALPLLLKPYAWARAFGWKQEPETDVGLYFGRCLGAVATAACVQGLHASRDPVEHRSFFGFAERSEEHTSELQSRQYLVCRLLLEKKKKRNTNL